MPAPFSGLRLERHAITLSQTLREFVAGANAVGGRSEDFFSDPFAEPVA